MEIFQSEFKYASFTHRSGLYEFGAYSFLGVYRGTTGHTFASFRDEKNGMGVVFAILIVEWFIFVPLAWYLEQARFRHSSSLWH